MVYKNELYNVRGSFSIRQDVVFVESRSDSRSAGSLCRLSYNES